MTVALLPHHAAKNRRRAFINNKGGVGKTRVAVHLGAALAARGNRVLMVDLDPQGNLTRRMAVPDMDTAITIGEVLAARDKGGAAAAISPCGWDAPEADRLHVIPADLSLKDRDGEAALPGSFNRLARVLFGVTDAYDYTLFDCRPVLGHLEQMLTRALDGPEDGYYMVVEPGADAISGAYRVSQEIQSWADDMDVDAPALGVIVNMYDDRTRLHSGRAAALEESLTPPDGAAPPILRPYLRNAIRVAEVNDLALPPYGDPRLKREGHTADTDALAKLIDQ